MTDNPYQPPEINQDEVQHHQTLFFDVQRSWLSASLLLVFALLAGLGALCALYFFIALLWPELGLDAWYDGREIVDIVCHLVVLLGFRRLLLERLELNSGRKLLFVVIVMSSLLLIFGVQSLWQEPTAQTDRSLLIFVYNCVYVVLGATLLFRLPNLYGVLQPLAFFIVAEGLLDIFSWLPLYISAFSYWVQDLCWLLLFVYAYLERKQTPINLR